jgi:hypothetical protein
MKGGVNGNAVPLRAKQARRGDTGIAVPILDPGAKRGWVVSATHRYPSYRRMRGQAPGLNF